MNNNTNSNAKYNSRENSEEAHAACMVRRESTLALKKAFGDANFTPHKFFYDTRTYLDESTGIEYLPWMFSKTLEHDPVTGFAKKKDVVKIVEAWEKGTIVANDMIPQSSMNTMKLENPQTSNSFNLMGNDPTISCLTKDRWTDVDSEAGYFEMMEVYSLQLLRDTSFYDISQFDTSHPHIVALNKFTKKASVRETMFTGQTLHRCKCSGERIGPYTSQFLLLPFMYGNLTIDQKYRVYNNHDTTLDHSVWLEIQNGKVSTALNKLSDMQYCWCPRVLGSIVHMDALYQFFYNASLIALQNGIKPVSLSNSTRTSSWVSSGAPDIFATVAHVALGALRCAWYSKYGLGMKIRPEVYAQRLEYMFGHGVDATHCTKIPGYSQLKDLTEEFPEILKMIQLENGCYMLNLLYPEGSPAHPSCPAGHAVVAGACCTVLKAMFDTHNPDHTLKAWPVDAKHSLNGTTLDDYSGADGGQMTIVGEFNKLASNVSIGRDMAGVHFRCDAYSGLKIGEEYAISYLMDKSREYSETGTGSFNGWLLHTMMGKNVCISAGKVENVP